MAACVGNVAGWADLTGSNAVQCRMQMGAAAGYASTGECIRQTVQREGWAGLSRGLGGTLARETPGNAIFFSVYEACA